MMIPPQQKQLLIDTIKKTCLRMNESSAAKDTGVSAR